MYSIYKIQNIITGECYIGLTKNPKQRWYTHLHRGKLCTTRLQRSMVKYGKENFTFCILETTTTSALGRKIENNYMGKYNSIMPNGFNKCLNFNVNREVSKLIISHYMPLIKGIRKKYTYLSKNTGITPMRLYSLFSYKTDFTEQDLQLINTALETNFKIQKTEV